MEKSTTLSSPFLRLLLPPEAKILCPRISFRDKTAYIENQYELYSRTCSDRSFMILRVDFTISYAPVTGIRPLCIIIAIAYAEGLIIFILITSNAFKNTILPNPEESFYLSITHLKQELLKRKYQRHPLASIKPKQL